ncbi:hypothetical protein ETECTG_CDS0290 [Escherichia phage ETEC-TG]|nr:hypothetical protein [Escherichia phage vB_EcoM_EP57]WPK30805.1 hypothetical protein ETECTG_CDS0290 [Escherichia phage ETEC-TG]
MFSPLVLYELILTGLKSMSTLDLKLFSGIMYEH